MHQVFNLKLKEGDLDIAMGGVNRLLNSAQDSDIYASHKENIKQHFNAFIANGKLDGNALSGEWFPPIEVDVFISHSHKDEAEALKLGHYLKGMGLAAFVDSCLWGCADKLLMDLDNTYCFKKGSNTYDYHARNSTTSHVHMMLAIALNKMLDVSECVLFLNTPNSARISDTIGDTITLSPWIYYELSCLETLRRRGPNRKITAINERSVVKASSERLEVSYRLNLDNLPEVSIVDLMWIEAKSALGTIHPLDALYSKIQSK